MNPIHSFGVIAFKESARIESVLNRICLWSQQNSVPVYFHPRLKSQLPSGITPAESECELLEKSDALLSVGGDGTFLSVAHMCRYSEKPVIGINLGGLGFLTDIGPDYLEQNLLKIK